MAGERKCSSVQTLGNISGHIYLDEEEWDSLLTRLLKGGQSMGRLLETHAKLSRKDFKVVASGFDRFCKRRIGHYNRRRRIRRNCSQGQSGRVCVIKASFVHRRLDILFQFKIGKLLCHLEILAGLIKRFAQQEFFPMPIQSS